MHLIFVCHHSYLQIFTSCGFYSQLYCLHNSVIMQLLSDKRVISGSDDGSMLLWTKCSKLQRSSELRPPPSLALAELALGKKRNDASEMRKSNPTPPSLAAGSYKINFASRCLPRASNINTAALCKSRTLHGHGGPVWCLSYNEATEQVFMKSLSF